MSSKKIKIPTDKDLQKRYKSSGNAKELLLDLDNSLRLPSSSPVINYYMGGGLPFGKILEIFGEESAGKSLLATDFARTTQALGGIVLWVDAEASYDLHWSELNGLDNDKVILYTETAIENISDWVQDMCLYWRNKLRNNQPITLVIDSIASLDCLDNIDSRQTEGKAEMGNRAKAIYKFFRIRNQMFSELGISVICINQLRDKVNGGMFQDPNTTPGGKALQFYASIRLGIFRGKQIKEKINGIEERVGNNVSLRIIKNKTSAPKPTLSTHVYFVPTENRDTGFSKYFGLCDVLIRLGVIERKGSRIYKGEELIATSEDNFYSKIEKDEELKKTLIRKSKINTFSRTLKNIERLGDKNLYPIKNAELDEE